MVDQSGLSTEEKGTLGRRSTQSLEHASGGDALQQFQGCRLWRIYINKLQHFLTTARLTARRQQLKTHSRWTHAIVMRCCVTWLEQPPVVSAMTQNFANATGSVKYHVQAASTLVSIAYVWRLYSRAEMDAQELMT